MKTTFSHSNQPKIESLQAQVEELTAKVRWYEEQFRLSQQNGLVRLAKKYLITNSHYLLYLFETLPNID